MSIKKEYTAIGNVIGKLILCFGFNVDINRLFLYALQEVSKNVS